MKNLLNPDYFLINKIPKSHKDLKAVENNHFLDVRITPSFCSEEP